MLDPGSPLRRPLSSGSPCQLHLVHEAAGRGCQCWGPAANPAVWLTWLWRSRSLCSASASRSAQAHGCCLDLGLCFLSRVTLMEPWFLSTGREHCPSARLLGARACIFSRIPQADALPADAGRTLTATLPRRVKGLAYSLAGKRLQGPVPGCCAQLQLP